MSNAVEAESIGREELKALLKAYAHPDEWLDFSEALKNLLTFLPVGHDLTRTHSIGLIKRCYYDNTTIALQKPPTPISSKILRALLETLL